MIKFHGYIEIPEEIIEHADKIKYENYKVNTPEKFQIRTLIGQKEFLKNLSIKLNIPKNKLDMVYFSVCNGAEPHTDKLNPRKFEDTTFTIPVIIPTFGSSILKAEDEGVYIRTGDIYEFDHTKVHSLELEDTKSGCVVIMIGILKDEYIRRNNM